MLEPALGPNSVLTLDEAPHMRQRKLLLPPFHGERIERYGELMREATLREMESWPVGEPFALRPHTQRITLAVIMRAVFGVHDERQIDRFERLVERFAGRLSMVTALPPLRRNYGRWSPWARFLRGAQALDEFVYEQIALRRAEVGDGAGEADDVLALLMSARHEDGSPMSDAELRDELVTVLVAGHETTATGLAWAIERLLRNREALGRLRESLAAGDEYLEATIKETLRVRPVLVDVARKLTAPLEIGGYELPADTYLMAAIAALHYREDLFPAPRSSGPSASSRARPTATPGSPSAAACGAASAPPSPNTRCGSCCGRSSNGPSSAPRTRSRKRSRSATSPSPPARAPWSGSIGRCARRRSRSLGFRRLPLLVELAERPLGLGVARFGALGPAGARPGFRVRQLFLELAQLGFRPLDPLGEPAGLARRLLRRPPGVAAAPRTSAPALPPAVAASAAASRSSRARWYSAQPLWCELSSPPSQTIVRVPTASSSARSWETRMTAPSKASRASSSASRLSMSRWLVGSSRISTLAPEATRIASERRRCSPPEMSASCFSTSAPEKRKPPSRSRAFCPLRPVSRCAASSTVPSPAAVSACWER